jgi:hypothetical protein
MYLNTNKEWFILKTMYLNTKEHKNNKNISEIILTMIYNGFILKSWKGGNKITDIKTIK